MKIVRTIQKDVEDRLFKGKVIIIYGARQVGKTTLATAIMEKYAASQKTLYLNCDDRDVRSELTNKTSTELKNTLSPYTLVVIDEAQRVENIGLTLKLLVDTYPEIQIIATGSSSFDLSNKISEPLTGRKFEFHLFPFSLQELSQEFQKPFEIQRILESRMLFGAYPEVVEAGADAKNRLREIVQSYLYKDVLEYQNIRHSEVLDKLLQALALQIGTEVSYVELAGLIGVNKITVENYVRILEQAFIIFRLPPLSRNLRNELKKMRKIYFYDLGVRNALINNFNPLELRQDVGALWENYMISERIKFNRNNDKSPNMYFWRTLQKQEIDYVEDEGGVLSGFEFKWKKDTYKRPKVFLEAYSGSDISLVNRESFHEFVGI
ncbi:MAG: ATP-binding protein [Candidatus Moraniibacteriota bacterium]